MLLLPFRFANCPTTAHGSTKVREMGCGGMSFSNKRSRLLLDLTRRVTRPLRRIAPSTRDTRCVGVRWHRMSLWFQPFLTAQRAGVDSLLRGAEWVR